MNIKLKEREIVTDIKEINYYYLGVLFTYPLYVISSKIIDLREKKPKSIIINNLEEVDYELKKSKKIKKAFQETIRSWSKCFK